MSSGLNAGMLGHEKLEVFLSKTHSEGPNGLLFLYDALNFCLDGRETISREIIYLSLKPPRVK